MANISQQKRQKMLEFLNKLKQEHQDDASLRTLGEIETALNEKKYGLVWEKHTEKVDEMLEHIKELIELEHHIEVDNEKYIILSDEDELENVVESIKENGKLFITSGIFLSRTHQRILDEKNVVVIDIPEYYYRSELKEVGEL